MRVDAITVSINYTDRLNQCIPFNKPVLDNWTVIGSERDERTVKLCKCKGVNFFATQRDYEPGVFFPKGAMLHDYMETIDKETPRWILMLDSDIALPPNIRQLLDAQKLDPNLDAIYGVDGRWIFKKGQLKYNRPGRVIGFFQLFHISHFRSHPMRSKDAGEDDMRFMRRFPNRIILPISVTAVGWGRNWKGRMPA